MKILLASGLVVDSPEASTWGFDDQNIKEYLENEDNYPEFTRLSHLYHFIDMIDDGVDQEALIAYVSNLTPAGRDIDYLNQFGESYIGKFYSEADFTKAELQESGLLSDVPDYLKNCIDYQKYWDQSLRFDHWCHGKYYFRTL